ncbi:hypothetical protein FKW77_000486 [Venturia effusa]|uniref:Aminoglycoside phosphotransferase domain-containing protein n=1 Tax=Venturia effusa TaxID=50376 RepID=A0A517LJJ6_9PEZI|nr:hypothetical protein FKW77_000486 [Venturia effusa]
MFDVEAVKQAPCQHTEQNRPRDTHLPKDEHFQTAALRTQALQTPKMNESPMSAEWIDDRQPSSAHSEPPCTVHGEEGDPANDTPGLTSREWGGSPQSEPFEKFQHKIMALCESLWPSHTIALEDIGGGSYSRIVGIATMQQQAELDTHTDAAQATSFSKLLKQSKYWFTKLKCIIRPACSRSHSTAKTMTAQYILRIPRYPDMVNLQHQAALIEFANRISKSWDVPTAIHLEDTTDNPLGVPFVIQNRIPGMNVDELWDNLNQQQRVNLGAEIGKVFRDTSRHSLPVPGTIDPTSISENSRTKIRVFEHVYENP